MSDSITVGNIHNSIGAAIGRGATSIVHLTNNTLPDDDRPKAAIHLPQLAAAFTGRLTHIQAIAGGFSHSPLATRPSPLVVTQAISGLGGVGKTQAALAYAHLYRPAYDIIWQLSADNTVALDDSADWG